MHSVAPSTRLHTYYFFQTWRATREKHPSPRVAVSKPSPKLQAAKYVQVYARLYDNSMVTSSSEKIHHDACQPYVSTTLEIKEFEPNNHLFYFLFLAFCMYNWSKNLTCWEHTASKKVFWTHMSPFQICACIFLGLKHNDQCGDNCVWKGNRQTFLDLSIFM